MGNLFKSSQLTRFPPSFTCIPLVCSFHKKFVFLDWCPQLRTFYFKQQPHGTFYGRIDWMADLFARLIYRITCVRSDLERELKFMLFILDLSGGFNH